ncbi:hypothetical protein BJ912DRAFT_323702 [Pholiota molesta]|nr:hypothetical protein BJ912DRAFT_323702 [Pholiota molesta]
MFNLRHIVTLAAIAASAFAQFPDLSSSCNSTIASLLQDNTISSCLGVADFEAIAQLIQNNSTASLVNPLNKWLVDVCSAPACSTDTLTSAATQLSTGCGFQIPQVVLTYYPTARKALCLQEDSTNCVTKTVTSMQKDVGGALNAQTIMNLIFTSNTPSNLSSDTAAYCTDCTKAIYNTIANDVPQFGQAGYEGLFQQQCGASFTNGTIPATISESFSDVPVGAANAATIPTSDALGAFSALPKVAFSGLGASALVVVTTMFLA